MNDYYLIMYVHIIYILIILSGSSITIFTINNNYEKLAKFNRRRKN